MSRLMTLTALLALTILTACDSANRADARLERGDRNYRAAMEDYRAGRLDAAIKGFRKALRSDPANGSARFQLACLLQDRSRDFVGAYVSYHEFLLQQPDSDKAKLAKDRLLACEREVARALASKYALTGGAEAAAAELEECRKSLKSAEERIARSEKDTGDALARIRSLSAERERLLAMVKGVGDRDMTSARPSVVKDARALLNEDDEAPSGAVASIAREAAALKGEDADENTTGSSLLPTPGPAPVAAPAKQETPQETKPARPKTHVVAEGDTLYGVSKRYYGSITAWKRIREANKALISSDNRLRVGDTIVLT